MPATEEFSRDQNTLHQWFGVTGTLMLLATLWMFGADHNREWKQYQTTAKEVELAMNQWRQLQAAIETNRLDHERYSSQLSLAQAQLPAAPLLAAFKATYAAHKKPASDEQLNQAFSTVDAALQALAPLAKTAAEKRAAYSEALSQAEKLEREIETARAAVAKAEADAATAANKEQAAQAVEAARAKVGELEQKLADLRLELAKLDEAAIAAEAAAAPYRRSVLTRLESFIATARYEEDKLLAQRKFKAAEFDAAKATKGLMVRDGKPASEQDAQQRVIDQRKAEMDALTLQYQAASKYRKDLQEIQRQIVADEDAARKGLEAVAADSKRLQTSYQELESTWFTENWLPGKKWLELPIVDAFGGPLKPDNLHYPKLTVDFNFKRVARFDRCTTCHKLIEKSLPGQPTTPAYVPAHELVFEIDTPREAPAAAAEQGTTPGGESQLLEVYGFRLAADGEGLVDGSDVTINYVRGRTRAAQARLVKPAEGFEESVPGLMVGDVVVKIGDDRMGAPFQVERALLQTAKWGAPVRLTIRRGLPQPYTTHPRLDLYLSSSSPHPLQTMGCSICHEGQPGATEFKWVSHSPNTVQQGKDWAREHGWFDNHHWIFPMYEKRFAESTCLKCHHDVTELEPSERFPEAPAPKVVRGHDLIRRYGCFGCHEVNGYDGLKRIGPDMRLEPNFYAVAEGIEHSLAGPLADLSKQRAPLLAEVARLTAAAGQLQQRATPLSPEEQKAQGIAEQQQQAQAALAAAQAEVAKSEPQAALLAEVATLARTVVTKPEDLASRTRLRVLIEEDKARTVAGQALLPAEVHDLGALLKDPESAGTLRKVGPSLRHIAQKDDPAFLLDWIRDPAHFRPDTLMPRFFGNTDHLDGPALKTAEEFEPLEIRAITEYLLARSQSFPFEAPPAGIAESTADEKLERGKVQFQTRGCLACHNHGDFPEAAAARGENTPQGPDLTGIGSKFAADRNPNGRRWLYSWIKHPTRYHPRTRMPDLYLDPIKQADGRLTDPVDDIVEYLLSGQREPWKAVDPQQFAAAELTVSPEAQQQAQAKGEVALSALDRLALEHLRGAFSERRSREILKAFSSPEEAERNAASPGGIPDSERGRIKGAEVELLGPITPEKKLLYIGSKAIAKYGCYACHDIPGFEDAKPIGTGLADWGRKNPTMLAFGHIAEYLHAKHAGHGHGAAPHGAAGAHAPSDAHKPGVAGHPPAGGAPAHEDLEDFYVEKLLHGSRIGFIAQKLFEPRSYDYKDVENKPYNDRLRMPKFPFDAAEREAVVTFVLGLVAEPPVPEYVYRPNPRQQAILEGKVVLEKYNCGGCHVLEMPAWDIAYRAGDIAPQKSGATFPFMQLPPAPPGAPDRAGMLHARVHGLPTLSAGDGGVLIQDAGGNDIAPDEMSDALAGTDLETYGSPSEFSYNVQIWSRALIYGPPSEGAPADELSPIPYDPGGGDLKLKAAVIRQKHPGVGGLLPLIAHAPVFRYARQQSSDWNNKGKEVWAWLPPPLIGEGFKVQPKWLHDFLLEPYPIRPAVVLRMPKFNMSSDEATKLVNYFAAMDEVEYPYTYDDRARSAHLAAKEAEFQAELQRVGPLPMGPAPMGAAAAQPPATRFDAAMRIVATTCAACHKIGDFNPGGDEKAKGPNLADVYRRLRPEYVRRWLAFPQRYLPYTPMPVNFKYDPTAPYEGGFENFHKYPGTTTQQLDGVTDVLMNFDVYARGRSSMRQLYEETQRWEATVKPPPPAEGAAPAPDAPAENPAPPAAPPASPTEESP